MCGIIGYIGNRDTTNILIEGLKRLEYRGYDSAGICISSENKLEIIKSAGKISQLQNSFKEIKQGNLGIAHTRWATHGEPNKINAHPHTDCKQEITIVHNGIIENFSTLKKQLIEKGHIFKSETDSEVIAHLIEENYTNNIEQAVKNTLKRVIGTYGLVIISKKENKIIGAKKGSPLIIGIGENEKFIASDTSAFLKHTKKAVYLEDNEIATLTKDSYKITKLNGDTVKREIKHIHWELDSIEKNDFDYFMEKEIFEQAETLNNRIAGRIDKDIRLSIKLPEKINRIIITACGTAWHAALIGKYIIEKYCKIPVEVDYASEFRYRNPVLTENDLIIVISQSGETADTLASLEYAKKFCTTLGIVNVVGSTISRKVDSGIFIHAGPEIGVASTKAFTGQVACLILLTLYLARKLNKIDLKTYEYLTEETKKIPEYVKETLKQKKQVKKIAEKIYNKKNALFLGRGVNFPVALEGALKLKEISYIHAEGYPAAEMKHGPIALIDENMPVVFIANKNDPIYEKIISNMQEVKARKGLIITVANHNDKEIEKISDYVLRVPESPDILNPIVNVIPLQLLAYYTTVLKGHNPDLPKNLAKAVTVE